MISVHRASRSKAILVGSLLGLTMFYAPAAVAATATSNMGVNVNVTANCTVSTAAVNFGSVDVAGAADDALGVLYITCTPGTVWTAGMGLGNGSGATFAARKMTAGANILTYSLFTDLTYTTVWGDGTGDTGTRTATANGATNGYGIIGRVFAGQTSVRAGNYSDVVVITVTY